jgi:hypothetical protein
MTTLPVSREIEEARAESAIERYASRLAENVLRLMNESLTGRVSTEMAWRGCRVPGWLIDWSHDDIISRAQCLVEGQGVYCDLPGGRWNAYVETSRLRKAAAKRCAATRPALAELFSGNWDGLKDSKVRRRIAEVHGRKIEHCDWDAYQADFIEPEMEAHYWQGAWYTAEGLAKAQQKRGAALVSGNHGELDAVVTPYVGMTDHEGLRYLDWAWQQGDPAVDDDLCESQSSDPVLDERLLNLGRMMLASERSLPALLHSFCWCYEDPAHCWMVPSDDLWGRAIRLDNIWHQLPGYKGANLAEL